MGFAGLSLVEDVSTRGVAAQLDIVDPNANLHVRYRSIFYFVVLTSFILQTDGKTPKKDVLT